MERVNFNKGWEFTFEDNIDEFVRYGFHKYSDATGPAARKYDYSNWQRVDLPHDWAVSLPIDPTANTFNGARNNSHYHPYYTESHTDDKVYNVGWYRKQFELDPNWQDKRLILEFEGVFRDAMVWVNGTFMLSHSSGYTGFKIDITDHLFWNETNSVAVRVDSDQPEGWWYEGSGIYRNVYLHVANNAYVVPEKTAITTDLDGSITFSSVVKNEGDESLEADASARIINEDGEVVANALIPVSVDAFGERSFGGSLKVDDPKLWSIENPYLYRFEIELSGDIYSVRIGVRTVAFDKDKGFFLNGKPVKVRGACNHQDFGGVGVALSDNLNRYKIQRLKDMGLNAYRCSHHAPSPALLDACDELGMLVMDETRLFGTSSEAVSQLTELIERDRNHPSVFIWSLGNEEFSVQNIEISRRLMEKATRITKTLDPTRPVTYGGNNGDNFVGANAAAEVRGFNYKRNKGRREPGKNWLDCYHEDHPHQPIIGTENTSYVLSRGEAINDIGSGKIDAFGNVTMPWGSTPKGWVKFTEERDFIAGGFMWTGFDYRGEPNPFVYTNFSSSFGTIDLCGMEKPPFYYYKAWWTDEPVLKLAAHWNFEDGEEARVAVMTNCDSVTLYLNGEEVAFSKVEKYDYPQFVIPFKAGTLEAVGVKNGKTYRDKMVTSGIATTVSVTPELVGNNEDDVSIFEINGFDKDGNFCPMASDKALLNVEGGEIVGVGNGDPSSTEPEQLLNGEEYVIINKFNYKHGLYTVPTKSRNRFIGRYDYIEREEKQDGFEDDFRLVNKYKYNLESNVETEFFTTVNLYEDYEYIEFERIGGTPVMVMLNGVSLGSCEWSWGNSAVRPYRFYGDFKAGKNEITVKVTTEQRADPPISGYVKIGKKVKPKYSVRLHYGKARVFVRSSDPRKIKLTARLSKEN